MNDRDEIDWLAAQYALVAAILLTGDEAFETWMTGTPDEAFALARSM